MLHVFMTGRDPYYNEKFETSTATNPLFDSCSFFCTRCIIDRESFMWSHFACYWTLPFSILPCEVSGYHVWSLINVGHHITKIFLSLDLIIGKDQSSIYMILDRTAVEIELIYNVWKVMNDVFQGSWPCKFQHKTDREDQALLASQSCIRFYVIFVSCDCITKCIFVWTQVVNKLLLLWLDRLFLCFSCSLSSSFFVVAAFNVPWNVVQGKGLAVFPSKDKQTMIVCDVL